MKTGSGGNIKKRVKNLEDCFEIIEIFEIIQTRSGHVTKPENSEILTDRYAEAGNALTFKVTKEGFPSDEIAKDNQGNVILVSEFDINGNYALDDEPSGYPLALIYSIKIPAKHVSEINIDNILDRTQLMPKIIEDLLSILAYKQELNFGDPGNPKEGDLKFSKEDNVLNGYRYESKVKDGVTVQEWVKHNSLINNSLHADKFVCEGLLKGLYDGENSLIRAGQASQGSIIVGDVDAPLILTSTNKIKHVISDGVLNYRLVQPLFNEELSTREFGFFTNTNGYEKVTQTQLKLNPIDSNGGIIDFRWTAHLDPEKTEDGLFYESCPEFQYLNGVGTKLDTNTGLVTYGKPLYLADLPDQHIYYTLHTKELVTWKGASSDIFGPMQFFPFMEQWSYNTKVDILASEAWVKAQVSEDVEIIDNLDSTSTTAALSANMGRELGVTKANLQGDKTKTFEMDHAIEDTFGVNNHRLKDYTYDKTGINGMLEAKAMVDGASDQDFKVPTPETLDASNHAASRAWTYNYFAEKNGSGVPFRVGTPVKETDAVNIAYLVGNYASLNGKNTEVFKVHKSDNKDDAVNNERLKEFAYDKKTVDSAIGTSVSKMAKQSGDNTIDFAVKSPNQWSLASCDKYAASREWVNDNYARLNGDSLNTFKVADSSDLSEAVNNSVLQSYTKQFTQDEKDKLAGLEDSLFLGEYISIEALKTAHSSPKVGSFAYVDSGTGHDVEKYIWDSSDNEWVIQGGATTEETPATIKTKYETNADTNNFNDALKTKLEGIPANANHYVLPSEVVQDSSYVKTDKNFTTTLKNKLDGVEAGANKFTLPMGTVIDGNYIHTDKNFTATLKDKLEGIEANANYYELPSGVVQDINYVKTDKNFTTVKSNKLDLIEDRANLYVLPTDVIKSKENHFYVDGLNFGVSMNTSRNYQLHVNRDQVKVSSPTFQSAEFTVKDDEISTWMNKIEVIQITPTQTLFSSPNKTKFLKIENTGITTEAGKLVVDSNYVHTDRNFTEARFVKLRDIETGANKYVLPTDVVKNIPGQFVVKADDFAVSMDATSANNQIYASKQYLALRSPIANKAEIKLIDNSIEVNFLTKSRAVINNIHTQILSPNNTSFLKVTNTGCVTEKGKIVADDNYVHTDNNFTGAQKTKLANIATEATKVTTSTVSGWGYKKTDTNTWNKVSTSQDGYISKLSNNSYHVLKGNGVWAYPKPATSAYVGAMPKLNNSPNYFLNGKGAWAIPPSSPTTVVDNLTTSSSTSALSAKMGYTLNSNKANYNGSTSWGFAVKNSDFGSHAVNNERLTALLENYAKKQGDNNIQFRVGSSSNAYDAVNNLEMNSSLSKKANLQGSAAYTFAVAKSAKAGDAVNNNRLADVVASLGGGSYTKAEIDAKMQEKADLAGNNTVRFKCAPSGSSADAMPQSEIESLVASEQTEKLVFDSGWINGSNIEIPYSFNKKREYIIRIHSNVKGADTGQGYLTFDKLTSCKVSGMKVDGSAGHEAQHSLYQENTLFYGAVLDNNPAVVFNTSQSTEMKLTPMYEYKNHYNWWLRSESQTIGTDQYPTSNTWRKLDCILDLTFSVIHINSGYSVTLKSTDRNMRVTMVEKKLFNENLTW